MTCQQNCLSSSTQTAQQKYQALATCARNKCSSASDTQTCIQQNCSTEVQACLGGSSGGTTGGSTTGSTTGGSTGGTGTRSCSEVVRCMQGCGQQDRTCLQNCYSSGTSTAQQQYQALATCARNKCGNATDQQTCVQNKCSSEVQACLGGSTGGGTTGGSTTGGSSGGSTTGGTGNKSCSEVLTCIQGCSQGDQTCAQNCYYSGTSTAQQQYRALATCAQNNCANATNPQTCLQNKCSSEWNTCQGTSP